MDDKNEIRERTKENKAKKPVSDIPISDIPISDIPISDIGYRKPQPGCLRGDVFFSGEYDSVDLAIAVTHGTRLDRLLWRKYLRNGSIEEGDFLQCVFTQWRENVADGEPAKPAACLQMKLKAYLKGGAR